MDYRAKPTLLKCVECDFSCTTGNDMCRHIYSTRHGTRTCPSCGASIVPKAFQASLQKLLDRHALDSGSSSGSPPTSAPHLQSPMQLARSSTAGATTHPLTRIHVLGSDACPENPKIRCYEKNDFVLAGAALEQQKAQGTALSDAGRHSSTSGPHHSPTDEEPSNRRAFRCMECLNFCPTWTQVSKHIEQSGHTLPVCAQCEVNHKCFGSVTPPAHELKTGHCGFFGVYYTRRDYRTDTQTSRWVYNSANLYTGLTTLQYRCVCGISFLHPVQVAEHLRRVHNVCCITDAATCHCCGLRGTLAEMMLHLRSPCWEKPGSKTIAPMVCVSTPQNPLAAAALEIGRMNAATGDDPVGLDAAVALSHVVEAEGFSGSAFLQFRPLLPPLSDEEVPLLGDAHALAVAPGGSASAAAFTSAMALQTSYAVLYQCRECLFLFSSWDGIVQHIHATGHCRTYCTKCNRFLPELLSQSASDGYAGWRSQPSQPLPPPPQAKACGCGGGNGNVSSSGNSPASSLGLSANLRDHIRHLQRDGDIIGYPASPETLEVLVDVRAACYSGTIDPTADTFTEPRTLMVYQCSNPEDGCYKVFLHYGDFVAHLLTSGHGTKSVPTTTLVEGRQVTLMALPTCYPMVTYRAKFTVMQLCEHFDFVLCPYCETAVPRAEDELHAALCVERRRRRARREN